VIVMAIDDNGYDGHDGYDVVVVGGGAAGLSAALVLARARRRVAVVDAGEPRNAPAAHVGGFLTRDGIAPAELLRIGRAEVAGYGGEVIDGRVEGVDRVDGSQPAFVVRLAGGRRLAARRLLVTTGLRDELPDVPGVRERWGRDVIHCPYCHGWDVRDQPIGVLAAGPAPVEKALLVRQWSPDVVLFPHTVDIGGPDRTRLAARGVRIADGEVVRLVVDDGADRLRGVELAGGEVVPRSALFVAPRFVARDDLLSQLGCALGDDGWVATDPGGRTSVPGVWAAGNVADPMAIVITSAAAGSSAAAAVNLDLVQEDVDRALAAAGGVDVAAGVPSG
jgi:thioredoxin reductase